MRLDPDAASAAAQKGFEELCRSGFSFEGVGRLPAMGRVDTVQGGRLIKLDNNMLSEEYGNPQEFNNQDRIPGTKPICIVLSENVDAYLQHKRNHGGTKLYLEPGQTLVRNLREVLQGGDWIHWYLRCAGGTCPKRLVDRTSFSFAVYRLVDSRPKLNYWIQLDEARIVELLRVLDVIGNKLYEWHQRMEQGHPEYQSEIDDLIRQCDRRIEIIAELDELGAEVELRDWFQDACGRLGT